MTPCIVLDTETTGFPNNGAGFCARLIEVGAVVVTSDYRVVSPISFYVRQPSSHLHAPQAQRAMRVHGISAAQILRDGLAPDEAAPRFAAWVERVVRKHGVAEIRAYNQRFDFWFLERDPWILFERTGLVAGEDIQHTAKRLMQAKRAPKLAVAAAHVARSGGEAQWLSKAHRAQEDARMAAVVAIHCHRQEVQAAGVERSAK